MGRVPPLPYLLGLSISDSKGLGDLRMGTLSSTLTEEMETAEGGSRLMAGLDGGGVLSSLSMGAESSFPGEPEISTGLLL